MPTFSYGCDFMMGLGKPKLCTKFFEVVSFSRCRNIKQEAPNFGELPLPRGWALANPSCMSNLKSLASSITEI